MDDKRTEKRDDKGRDGGSQAQTVGILKGPPFCYCNYLKNTRKDKKPIVSLRFPKIVKKNRFFFK